ncbi:WcaI family glycosyltransferase [Parerythrobacter jejuensis]|uniref:WcaI family glycosyltransferase n=1 Tax=Parerythrobacter jejuensis TaxID=795812 RepID=A0A845ANT8_9SPHN|nr:WcaI family glycosyltransferase [Parerythrobacter jejuensis]MXP31097.1 WcaI family glycosyltransferase [Parerythrobacter jejuensis]MXP33857.1 WcaI family glycosyltransferase [Parerythrobacter jejuensis]
MAFISIIGLNYAPEPIGIGPYTQGWATSLAQRGHRVQVICGAPYYPGWSLAAGYKNRFAGRVEDGVEVLRVPHYIPARPTAARRMAHYASFAANAARAVHRQGSDFRPDAVVAIAPALLAAPVALRLARKAGALSWLHIQDFEVGAALATSLLPASLANPASRFERSAIKRFDHVSTIAPAMLDLARSKGAGAAQLHELRNWAEPGVGAAGIRPEDMRAELGLPARKIALYSGNLARKQGIDLILDTAERTRNRADLHFVVCGEGPAVTLVEQAAEALPNLHYRPLQPRSRLPELLAVADIHMLPQLPGAADLVLPSKLANMLASGRPVVTSADPGTALAREVAGCGIVVSTNDREAFANAITALADDQDRRETLGNEAKIRANERWSRTGLLDAFGDALESALQDHRQ